MADFESAHAHFYQPHFFFFFFNDWIGNAQTSPQMKHSFGTFLSAQEVQLYICAM